MIWNMDVGASHWQLARKTMPFLVRLQGAGGLLSGHGFATLGTSPRVLMKVEHAVKVEPVGEFELKGIRRPLAAYNVVGAVS
jgi:hypothetical protein